MKKIAVLSALIVIICASLAGAQEVYFGKNKVQYRDFDWYYIQTDHFDIYFYDNEYDLAKFAADELESAYGIITKQLNYFVARRIPVFVYSSHNDFQQTNITWDEPSEGTQGFTEVFKNRMVVHFMGSYEEFRHLLHHELTHAVVFDLLYGQFFKSIISSNRLFQLPLWFAEGYAEFSSNGGWTVEADMMVRDATINSYLRPPGFMGFQAYTEGFALVKYIVDNYGIEKLGEILRKGKSMMTMDRALKSSIGMDSEELYDKFSKELKKRYWPDIAQREEPKEFSKQLTKHGKDGSHFNEKPIFSPVGQKIAMFTDRNGYTEIYLISAIDGKDIKRLVKGERNSDLESLRWYFSGMSFAPDGEKIVFVAKSKGEDALNFLKIDGNDIYMRKKFGLKSVISPAWSPDGKMIAFTALYGPRRDIYLYNLDTDELKQLTSDHYDDKDVAWFPDNKRVIFTSDRPHPDESAELDNDIFNYGAYNLNTYDLSTGSIQPLVVGAGNNIEPAVSPDGERIAFVSDRNGIQNIYIYYTDSARTIAVTNALTDAKSPTWSSDGKMIAFSAFYKGGYDIFLLKDLIPKGENGVIAATDFIKGAYDGRNDWARQGVEIDVAARGTETAVKPALLDPDFPFERKPGMYDWESATADTGGGESATAAADTSVAVVQDTVAIADSTAVDSLAVASADSTEAAAGEEETGDTDDKTGKGEVGEDDIYVYRGPSRDASVFKPEGELNEEGEGAMKYKEAVDSVNADSLDNLTASGDYRVRPYHTRFTPDIIAGGLQYDNFFGFRGQTVFLFSDYLGDHQIIVATDLVNTIDQSNIQAYYYYNRLRVDFGIGAFHTKNYYIDPNDDLFSDRFYGVQGFMSWPRSRFTRIDLNSGMFLIDRKYYDSPTLDGKNIRFGSLSLSLTHDNILWGVTGPSRGRRYKLTTEAGMPLFGDQTLEYYSGEIDYRQYFKLGRPFTFAFRLAGGISGGGSPKTYYLGGNTNNIGSISVGSDVYTVENLYFSSVITPLRGYDYYEIAGTRFAVTNMEIRFPFIEYFLTRYPLTIGLANVNGALFMDMGAAWDEGTTFKGATSEGGSRLVGIKTGFGFGIRANLGFLVLRYDMAWRTDFHDIAPHTKHYFSLGTEF